MKLSFVIPAYNAEKFIVRCIKSITEQKGVDGKSYEIIVVNDGSKDGTEAICLELENEHPQLHLYNNENHGPGYTRNFGMKKAQGKYVWFVDSDDYLENGILSNVMDELDLNKPMYVVGFKHVTESGEEMRKMKFGHQILTSSEFLNQGNYVNYVWCRVIRRNLFEKHQILFREDAITAEDFHLIFRLMKEVEELKCIDRICYNYVLNPKSLMNSRSQEHMKRLAYSTLLIGRDLRTELNNINDSKKAEAFETWLSNYLYGFLFSLYRFKYSPTFVIKMLDQLKRDDNYPVNAHLLSLKRKLFTTMANQRFLFVFFIKMRRIFF
ncbi:glycosyltransferase family 2 protein [Flagellimonas baculiformis]|uniref:glycosyltransferase family 2 protein n=1 Tax=Flagellimonas baculiformis TaxID=3067310 RepID=UPI00296F089D|nr:glycosyltransferase family 2 protein [Muricauda sp. D6]